MACIFKKKNSPYYYVRYTRGGKLIDYSTKSRNYEVAKRIRNKMEDEIALGNLGMIPTNKNISVDIWLKEFLDDKKRIHTAGSFDRCTRNINRFLSYCKEIETMRQFDSTIIKKYIQKREQEIGDWAVENEFITIKSFFNEYERTYRISSPAKGIKVKKPHPKAPNLYTQDEIRIMLGIKSPKDRAMLLLDLLAGLRKGEMASRKWKDIDFGQNKVWVRVDDDFVPKDKETRFIPLNPFLKEALLEWHRVSGQNKEKDYIFSGRKGMHTHFDILMRATLKNYGIIGHCKKFRDSFASYSLASGAPPQNVRDWLGHFDITMTNHYLNYLPKAVEPDIKKLFEWRG